MSFLFHFYILRLTSWIWTNPAIEGLEYESPLQWNAYEGFNLEHWMPCACVCVRALPCWSWRWDSVCKLQKAWATLACRFCVSNVLELVPLESMGHGDVGNNVAVRRILIAPYNPLQNLLLVASTKVASIKRRSTLSSCYSLILFPLHYVMTRRWIVVAT